MLKVSMIVGRRAQIYILVFINLSLSGSLLTPFLMPLTLSIFALFLFVIDLASCFFLYILLVYLGYIPCASNKFALHLTRMG